MPAKSKQRTLLPNLDDGMSSKFEPNTLVTIKDQVHTIRRARITLAALSVAIDEGDDYGGTKICDLPDKNLLILGVECDLVLTKGGVTNGLEAATDINTAIGTAVASNATLSSTMVDVIDIVANTASSLTHDMKAHSQANSPANMPLEIGDGASIALYLNAAASITASDAVTATGIIDVYYVDLGNLTS